MFGKHLWHAAAAMIVTGATLGFAATAEAQWGHHGHYHGGHGHIGHYYGHGHGYGGVYGGYGGYGGHLHAPYYYGPTWHDTSHFDYHPGYHVPHGNHFHYVPGHYDFHRSGHWHW